MAERRMFAKSIVLSDSFLDMPMSARCLYFTLNMFADDDGFVGSPKGVMRQSGASQDDMAILLQKKFVIGFESGVIVIKHWRINNYLQSDRRKPTTYLDELKTLALDDNKSYIKEENNECIQNVYNLDTQYSIGKVSIVENSIEKNNKPVRHKYGEYKNVLFTDEEYEKLKNEFPTDYEQRIENLSFYLASKGDKYKSHLATIRNWARKEKKEEKKPETTQKYGEYF